MLNYQVFTKFTKLGEKLLEACNRGGSPWTTWHNCSKTELHLGYGNLPVATSTRVIPKDQTSERTS